MGTLYSGPDSPAHPPTGEGAARRGARDAARHGPGPYVMSCATLAGDAVVNTRGENLGKLEHIVLDVPSGRIAYGVLARGGVFGIGEKLFAIPWHALALDAARRCFVLEIDRDRLEKSPGFDRDRWPAMGDAAWASRVHDYYGVRPYWVRDSLP